MKFTFSLFSNMSVKTRTFLFWFSNEHSNFRFAELDSLFKLFQLDQTPLQKKQVFGPFVLLDFPSDEAPKKLMSRSVLAHSCYEVWSSGDSMDSVHTNFKNNLHFTQPFVDSSFRLKVDTYGKTIGHSLKLELIETFHYIPLDGKVDLKNPDCSLHLIQYYGVDPNHKPENPFKIFFGRWIADGQRRMIYETSLKSRKFIGNTSMDPLLSLLMANLALVKANDLVLDPFVGTGSLLVAAALMGGFVLGTDIDYLMLHGRTRPSRASEESRANDESIRANLMQYNVESKYLDVLVADASRPAWKDELKFDSIISDPPYGVRESTERIGSMKSYKIKKEHIPMHIPSKVEYTLCNIFCDLINFSAARLALGGRIVVWIPVCRSTYDVEKLPKHPCFQLISNCEQVLTASASRRLIVLEKIAEPTETCCTTMDNDAPMYKFKFYDTDGKSRREKKSLAIANFGTGSKRGHLQSSFSLIQDYQQM